MLDILGSPLTKIRDEITKASTWLYNKKQSKITISSIEPVEPDDGDFWIDMGSVTIPPSYDKFYEVYGITMDCYIMDTYLYHTMDIDCYNLGLVQAYLDVDGELYDTTVTAYLDIDCKLITPWMLTCGAKLYDRMYLNHYKAAYYGYYSDQHNNYMVGDKYEPTPIGSLVENSFSVSNKTFYITALMAMYDERNQSKEGNGFNVLFGIYIEDGIIPFESITIGFHHHLTWPEERDIEYVRTIYASEFSTESIYTRYVSWPDETNGAIPKLFEVLHDFWRFQVGEVPLEVSVSTVNGEVETYYISMKQEDSSKVIELPTTQICSIIENGISISKGYMKDSQQIALARYRAREESIEEIFIRNYACGNLYKNELLIRLSTDKEHIELWIDGRMKETMLRINTNTDVWDDGYIHIRDERVVALYETALSSQRIKLQMR